MPRISAKEFERTRKKRSESQPLPVDEERTPKPIEDEPAAPPVQVIEKRIEMVMVEIPLGEPPRRFDQVHVEGWLRGQVAHTFARLRQALRDRGAKTPEGRPVESNPDVLRWLMEQIGI